MAPQEALQGPQGSPNRAPRGLQKGPTRAPRNIREAPKRYPSGLREPKMTSTIAQIAQAGSRWLPRCSKRPKKQLQERPRALQESPKTRFACS
eukprot:9490661-Pyramimonas_sp.AAC.1